MERKETTRKYRDAKKELTGKSFLLSSAWNKEMTASGNEKYNLTQISA